MSSKPVKKRRYTMRARADAASATADRILAAAEARFLTRPFAEVTLAEVADDAGVTVQTVMRRYGSKEELAEAASRAAVERVRRERMEAPVGDVAGAVRNLCDHYEAWGDAVLRLVEQAREVPAWRRVTEQGRQLHVEWVGATFAPFIARIAEEHRSRRSAMLVAVTDAQMWHMLRRTAGLPRDQVEQSLRELIDAVLSAR